MKNSRPSPVRPYKRFIDNRVADSGVDPVQNYARFALKQQSLDAYRDSRMGTIPRSDSSCSIPQGQVPSGTTKHTYKIGLGVNAKLDRNALSMEARTFPKNPTDNISVEAATSKRPFQGVFDQIVKKPNYDKNVPTSVKWEPKAITAPTANNRSGVQHNIITNESNRYSAALEPSTKLSMSYGRAKGVTEIRDLLHPSKVNTNADHGSALGANKQVFARKDGMFTHLYNSAARFGEVAFKH